MKSVLGVDARLVWHKQAALPAETAGVLVPGGFSYGDYLRCGAMARFSPIMADVRRFAEHPSPPTLPADSQASNTTHRKPAERRIAA